MNLYRKFVLTAALSLIVCVVAYIALFFYQFGAPIASGYDAANWITYKELVGNNTEGKRLLLFGDSSTVFGVNSKTLSEKLGVPVANLALHGNLPLDAITESAIKNSRAGDTVVLAPVWIYYLNDYRVPKDWILREMVAWYSDYFYGLPLKTKLKYISAVDVKTLSVNVDAKFRRVAILQEFPNRRALTAQEVKDQHAKIDWTVPQPFSYTFLNMNEYGDMQGACGNQPITTIASVQLAPEPKVNPQVLKLLKQTAQRLNDKGVNFYIMPSVTVEDERSVQQWYHLALGSIMDQIRKAGIPALGTPEDFFFPKTSFYDTSFHINCESTPERTSRIYNILKDVLHKDT